MDWQAEKEQLENGETCFDEEPTYHLQQLSDSLVLKLQDPRALAKCGLIRLLFECRKIAPEKVSVVMIDLALVRFQATMN